jgi:predicted glutamine amidotransferase
MHHSALTLVSRHFAFCAHAGAISGFASVRHLLEAQLSTEAASIVRGETDSELCFGLFLTELGDLSVPQTAVSMAQALDRVIGAITRTTAAAGVQHASSLNFAVTNGVDAVVSRYRNSHCEAQQPPSLYLNFGTGLKLNSDGCLGFQSRELGSVVISSEPLCNEVSGWAIVPKNTMVLVVADANDTAKVGALWLAPVMHGVDIEAAAAAEHVHPSSSISSSSSSSSVQNSVAHFLNATLLNKLGKALGASCAAC